MSKCDVLLISVGNEGRDRRQSIPLALPVLKGVLENKNYQTKCIDDYFISWNTQEVYNLLDKFKPKIIGLSATAYEFNSLKKIVRTIKSYSIEIAVILGGYCSLLKDLAKKTGADAVCHGEGEKTIIELVEIFKQPISSWNTSLKNIKGISFVDETSGNTIKNQSRALIQNLDTLPFPDYSDFLEILREETSYWIPFYAQRGCYNNCTFCDIIPFYGEQKIRSMSPERIVQWIRKTYEEMKKPYYLFTDDNFMSKERFLKGMISELSKSQLNNKIWINFQTRANDIIRFQHLLPELKPFIFSIELGVESFSDSQLLRFNKNISKEQNLKAIHILSELNIPYNLYFMFLDGKTTIEELKENIKTILTLPDVPNFGLENSVPEIINDYQYSALCDLQGNPTIKYIPFLEAFHHFLEETEEIRKAFVLYRTLKKIKSENKKTERNTNEMQNFQTSFFSSIGKSFSPRIEKLGRKRLKKALEIAGFFQNNKLKGNPNKNKQVEKEIKNFNTQIDQILKPFIRIGVNFEDLAENY